MIRYQPTIDLETDLKNQDYAANLISVLEIGESKEAFLAPIQHPHTNDFREGLKGAGEGLAAGCGH